MKVYLRRDTANIELPIVASQICNNTIYRTGKVFWTLISFSFQALKSMGLGRMQMGLVLCVGVFQERVKKNRY
jgi:hypothetical protein